MRSAEPRPLYTIGHSTRPVEEVIDMLRGAAVSHVIDVRTVPRSRANPQFDIAALPGWLGEAGLSYRHLAALGGLRGRVKTIDEADNAGWTHRSFHNYADYAQTDRFREGLGELLALAARFTCAIMCAEAVWWRCHRRIIADHVLARGVPVVHLMTRTRREPAALTRFAVVHADASISYPRAAVSTATTDGATGS